MNPHYGDFDTYHMAASAIDEAMRNAVAVGADPSQNRDLGQLLLGVYRSSRDAGIAGAGGDRLPRLGDRTWHPVHQRQRQPEQRIQFHQRRWPERNDLDSAEFVDQCDGADRRCFTRGHDGRQASGKCCLSGRPNQVGVGRIAFMSRSSDSVVGKSPPSMPAVAKTTFHCLHQAMQAGLVRACHDFSEGGLAVAATEMAMAGGLGMQLTIDELAGGLSATEVLFSESNSRFLVEVTPDRADEFQNLMQTAGVSVQRLGTIEDSDRLIVQHDDQSILDVSVSDAKDGVVAAIGLVVKNANAHKSMISATNQSTWTVVVSRGQSRNPQKRALEQAIAEAAALLDGVDVVVVPHLYDLPKSASPIKSYLRSKATDRAGLLDLFASRTLGAGS